MAVILKAHPAVDAMDSDGWTPLHFAAQRGAVDVIKALLAAGASCEVTSSKEGYRPLHLAVDSCPSVDCLLDAGADRGAIDGCGCMAVHYAAQLGDDDSFFRLWMEDAAISTDVHGRIGLWVVILAGGVQRLTLLHRPHAAALCSGRRKRCHCAGRAPSHVA